MRKHYVTFTIGLFVFVIICCCGIGLGILEAKRNHKIQECTIDTITVYNPTNNQCDSEPLITASQDTINLNEFPTNWIALSQELIKSGDFKYGDSILVTLTDSIPKIFVLKDTKNKRYNNHGDILCKDRKYGMWYNVKIRKL